MIDFEKESQISIANQRKLFRWFARQNHEIKIEVFKTQKNKYFMMKNIKNYNIHELSLLTFMLAISDIFNQISQKNIKNKDEKLKNIKSPLFFRAKQIKKDRNRVKYERLLNLKSVIFHLRGEDMSFYQISNYLIKWHKLEVSHTWIRKFYNDLRNKGE